MRYNNIDITKLIMAFFVVAIHVATLSNFEMSPILNFIVRLAVPFFYIVTGYFLYPNFFEGTKDTRKRVITKYIKMYLVWTLIYLPFAFIYYIKSSYSINTAIFNYFWNFFLTGETPMAWQMWYMHSLIISVLVLWVTLIMKIRIEVFIAIIFGLFLLLDLIIAFYIQDMYNELSYIKNGQNSLMTGLPALCTGILIKKYNIHLFQNNNSYYFAIIITLVCIILYLFNLHAYCIIFSAFVFILMMSLPQLSGKYYWANECSKYVYFLHLMVAFALRGLIGNFIINWFVVCCITMLMAIGLLRLKKHFRFISVF